LRSFCGIIGSAQVLPGIAENDPRRAGRGDIFRRGTKLVSAHEPIRAAFPAKSSAPTEET
jgi:hypothetical protein